MIAITVSTNYHDILPYILEANLKHIEHWIFVTDVNDRATIDLLTPHSNVTVLYWDFKNNGRSFDKGGAAKHAQQYAYSKYPDAWYLMLDSDICFPSSFNIDTALLDSGAMYTTNRQDFDSLSSYRQQHACYQHPLNPINCLGYFQLYKHHVFYESSNTAGKCDDDFNAKLPNRCLDIMCSHLGSPNTNWSGRAVGSDFVID
jgi:hypothetical protein